MVEAPNSDYYYLCTELCKKWMIPVVTKIRAHSAAEFGDLIKHAGEQYIYVLKGRIVVATEFYDTVMRSEGESIYLDSSMGHAYLTADDGDEAEGLGVMSSTDGEPMQARLTLHGVQQAAVNPPRRKRAAAL